MFAFSPFKTLFLGCGNQYVQTVYTLYAHSLLYNLQQANDRAFTQSCSIWMQPNSKYCDTNTHAFYS